ncbi:MAG: paaI [Flaviaesturariibacter sp.]|nr:paaI [Flaviaesturariibacter sp.]
MTTEEKDALSRSVIAQMMRDDAFSQWLGITLLEVREGYSRISMTLRADMLNGFGVIHGGIAFSLADSAFAFACNSRNNLSVALDTSITFTKSTMPGDTLTAEAREIHNGLRTGLYQITITNAEGAPVAHF